MIRFLIAVSLVLLGVLVGGLMLPNAVTVQRAIDINRPAATVFTVLNGFHAWSAWSPWSELDPSATLVLTGPDAGVGARLEWSGDPSLMGFGWQEIVTSEPYREVGLVMALAGQELSVLRYEVADGGIGSRVSWHYEADVAAEKGFLGALVGRYYGLFLKRWVATDFERGLERLKTFAERLPEADFSGAPVRRERREGQPMVLIDGLGGQGPGDVANALAIAFTELAAWALANDVSLDGSPMTITRSTAGGGESFAAALLLPEPIDGATELALSGRIQRASSPAGEAVCLLHQGRADDTLASYERLYAWLAAHGLREADVTWEHYLSEGSEEAPASSETDICLLLRDGD